jgi:hypothetical protein
LLDVFITFQSIYEIFIKLAAFQGCAVDQGSTCVWNAFLRNDVWTSNERTDRAGTYNYLPTPIGAAAIAFFFFG